jgi:predicted dehydrogenase
MPTRRHFLQSASAAGLAAPLAAQTKSPNDRIQIALIGAGGMGSADAISSLAQPDVELVAVADVYDGRLERAKERWGTTLFTTRDYREVLAKPDIDAVIIGTPDHWHAQIAIDAMNAGKDVYVEKPMVQKIADGPRVVEAQRKTKRILQVGSQRVSSIVYAKAKDLLKGGAIGQLNMVDAWWDRNSAVGAWQYAIPPDASPQTIDWDRFLGNAPKRPFEPTRLFRWRNYQDYGTGVAGDLFVHLFSGLHYILGTEGPTRVFSTGGLRFWKDGRDVPDVLLGIYDYPATAAHPAFNLALRVNFVSGAGETSGFRFVGSEGILTIGNGVTLAKTPRETEPGYTIETFPKPVQEKFLAEYRQKYPQQRPTADAIRPKAQEEYLPPRGYDDHREHHRVFIEAVRSRQPVIEDAAFGFRAAGPALLSNTSYFEKRVVNWDARKMQVKG